jgi:general secretion pathway protein A
MYNDFFLLRESPFAITPDPRYLYMSERHADALAHLLYGINEAGGFIQLTGEVGTGKTTLVRALLERLPQNTDVAVILNPRVSPIELLQSVCDELRVPVHNKASASSKELIDTLNEHLLTAYTRGRRVVVLLDEAQNLSQETLEQVRLLTNLETSRRKLLQIILVGQPELRAVLSRNELRQLAQRITGRFHLGPLSRQNTASYVRHRLSIAGATADIFTAIALREVHRLSGGVPRVINVICDRALLGAYTQSERVVNASMVRRAAGEVYSKLYMPRWFNWAAAVVAVYAMISIGTALYRLSGSDDSPKMAAAPVSTPPAPAPELPKLLDVQTFLNQASVPMLRDASNNTSDGVIDDTSAAFATLFKLWGAKFNPTGARPCEQASAQGLQCVYQKGSWGQLRLLNRPAILSINLPNGATRQVTLSALNDDSAQLNLGDRVAKVSLLSLSRDWLGEYLLLWRPQSPAQRELSIGMRGNEVRWLRKSLDQLAGVISDSNVSDQYDRELADRVGEFQRQHRLNADGIAGMQTLILLDNLIDSDPSPRLTQAAQPSQSGEHS